MNILLYVTAMIMLITLVTYANIISYRDSAPFRRDYVQWMEQYGREYINAKANQRYDETHFGNGERNNKQSEGTSKLSFYLFVNQKARDSKQHEYDTLFSIAKRLMEVLYQQESWYQEVENERPTFLDEILMQLVKVSEIQKVRKAKDLANIDLEDTQLNEVFYKVLKGTVRKAQRKKKSDEGYFSLLDFINTEPSVKIRIYLAPREILQALYFNNPTFVEEILIERRRIYHILHSEKDKNLSEQYSKEFKEFFTIRSGIFYDESILDFTVSKTNPAEYE